MNKPKMVLTRGLITNRFNFIQFLYRIYLIAAEGTRNQYFQTNLWKNDGENRGSKDHSNVYHKQIKKRSKEEQKLTMNQIITQRKKEREGGREGKKKKERKDTQKSLRQPGRDRRKKRERKIKQNENKGNMVITNNWKNGRKQQKSRKFCLFSLLPELLYKKNILELLKLKNRNPVQLLINFLNKDYWNNFFQFQIIKLVLSSTHFLCPLCPQALLSPLLISSNAFASPFICPSFLSFLLSACSVECQLQYSNILQLFNLLSLLIILFSIQCQYFFKSLLFGVRKLSSSTQSLYLLQFTFLLSFNVQFQLYLFIGGKENKRTKFLVEER